MRIVNEKINKMQVQRTSVSKNPHIELASSITPYSLLQPSAFAIEAEILKNSLYNSNAMIIGNIRSAIVIIAIIPQEFFMSERLAVTVLKASFTVEPIIGIKLLIANLAVFIEIESAVCDKTFLQDKTNIKIDIINTVTPVNVFFNVLDIPLKSN